MPRFSVLALLVFLLLVAGLSSFRGAVLALAVPILLYWSYSLWRAPEEIKLDVQRKLSAEHVPANSQVHIEVRVTNLGDPVQELAIEDEVPAGLEIVEGCNHHLVTLTKRATFRFEYTVRGGRGSFPFEKLRAEASDHFGLIRLTKEVLTSGRLLVLPSIMRIREIPIRPRRTRVYAGVIPARVGGAGVEFFGVRAYTSGDSPRHINWHASARRSEDLLSNEFQQERVADVGLVLDGRERSNLVAGGHSLFEYSVQAAGAIADSLLHQGNRVGLLVYSNYLHWTLPGYGKIQRYRIIQALGAAAPGASQIFDGLQLLPARFFPAESQIVLISPLVDDDYPTLVQLRARGYQIMIVSPDPVAFEVRQLPRRGSRYSVADVELSSRIVRLERELMLSRIRRAGVQVVEWDVSQPFDQMAVGAFKRAVRNRRPL
jgi:uncharacterized protein (DUF58 family)